MRQLLIAPILAGLLAAGQAGTAQAHGSVAPEDDRCIIDINFLTAHFTIFQPENRGSTEYCEDVPDATQSIFVMEYLHDLLQEMYVDFRIIRDETGIGRFANWDDIIAMGDLEPVTEYYQAPSIEPGGYFRASHEFTEEETYIGIVTARHPTEPRNYQAVFFFRVGDRDWGSAPLFIALILLAQFGYWAANGGLRKLRKPASQS